MADDVTINIRSRFEGAGAQQAQRELTQLETKSVAVGKASQASAAQASTAHGQIGTSAIGAAKSVDTVGTSAAKAGSTAAKAGHDAAAGFKAAEGGAKSAQGAIGNLASYGQQRLQSFAGSGNLVTKSIGEIGKAGFSAGEALKVGMVGGILAVSAALAALTAKGIVEFGKMTAEVRKLKAATGESAEESSRAANVARALGVDIDVVAKGYVILSRNIANSAERFAQHNVEIAKAKDGSVDLTGTIANIAEAYQHANSAQERNAILVDLLGKGGTALRPILAANREEIEKLAKGGPIFKQDDLDKGRQLAIAQREMGEAIKTLEIDLARGLIPTLVKATESTTTFIHAVDKVTGPIGGLGGLINRVADGVLGYSLSFAKMITSHEKGATSSNQLAAAQKNLGESLKVTVDRLKEEREELDKLARSQETEIDATLNYEHAQTATVKAIDAITKAQIAQTKAIEEHGASSEEATIATDNLGAANQALLDAVVSEAKAHRDQTVAQREANNETVTGQDRVQLFKQYLVELANTIGGPLAAQLLDLAGMIKDLPENKTITINLDAANARAAAADLRSVLFSIPDTKTIELQTSVAYGSLVYGYEPHARGGHVAAGSFNWVGEEGPEPFIPDVSGTILPNGSPLPGGGMSVVFEEGAFMFGAIGDDPFAPTRLRQAVEDGVSRALDQIVAHDSTGWVD